jgi:two-component system, cell cycle sensor histidine kinase and response regulator CckA
MRTRGDRTYQTVAMPETRDERLINGRPPELAVVRLLVVDDDPQAQALIEMALVDAHFDRVLEIVPTAAEGLHRIEDDEHDCYLVDYRLPDGNGLELIHEAKAQGATKPFILMTGYGSGDIDEAALKEGVADYVEKHMLATHLERSIRYALRDWQADRALHDREDQLRQAQKMEAIGRLAGGVAHDFNNLLTAIIGYTDVIFERLPEEDQTHRDVSEIRKAADRAAALTRQLLAFGRKQFLRPEVLDLNETATELLQMLPRVIGEHIQTVPRLAPNLRRVQADRSQMEQVLVNLVLNARDAMPTGGVITIETSDTELTPSRIAADGLSVQPGSYVLLSVTDTGTGMDAKTRAHAFEPFFTTKPTGKGTGLGLATVYGIVDQSGGAITIQTALGHGTSIRIYLPAVASPVEIRPVEPKPAITYGTESILLVEDNDAVRELAQRTLKARGYAVIEARNGDEAIDLVARGAHAQLLLTDVVMPGLSGPNLAARLLQQNPRLRVLYMSGFNEDSAAAHGTFWGGVPLLQKPFTPSQLAERVRVALDTTAGPA